MSMCWIWQAAERQAAWGRRYTRFCGAQLRRVALRLSPMRFPSGKRVLADADLVTGEGRIDSQTIHGKSPAGGKHRQTV